MDKDITKELSPADTETVRVKPDVYIAALLDEQNDHLVEIADLLKNQCDDDLEVDPCDKSEKGRKIVKKPVKKPSVGEVLLQILEKLKLLDAGMNALRGQHSEYYTSAQTAISVATPTKPSSPDVIAAGTTPGYQIESVYNQLQRISPKITVINDGTSNLFVITTPDAITWSPETLIAPGETYTFFNVWEMHLRSPVAGNLIPVISGGVYRVTEYDIVPRIKLWDQPDQFGVNTTIGLAEHAARLGSPMAYERRGNMRYCDDYESPTLKAQKVVPVGGVSTATRSSDTAFMGTTSLKLTTTANATDFVGVRYLHMDFNDQTKVGGQVSFSSSQTQADGFFTVMARMDFFDGAGNDYRAFITYVPGLNRLQYRNNVGADVLISDAVLFSADILNWCTTKIVMDLNTKEYVRFIIFGQTFDLSGIALQQINAPGEPRRLEYTFYLRTDQNAVKIVYNDNYILTDSEP